MSRRNSVWSPTNSFMIGLAVCSFSEKTNITPAPIKLTKCIVDTYPKLVYKVDRIGYVQPLAWHYGEDCYWCCPLHPPLAWCSQCRGHYNTVPLSNAHGHGVMTNVVCLLMVTWTWWHLHHACTSSQVICSLLCQIGCINDRTVKTKKVPLPGQLSFYNLHSYTTFSIFGH